MIGRARHHRSYADDVDPNGLFVFIPGALASGFLVSVALLLADASRKIRGTTGSRRRVRLTSVVLSEEIRTGADASRSVATGLRPRWVYGITGAAMLGVAIAVAPGATWNFLDPHGYISHIAWMWALSLLGVLVFLMAGINIMRVVPEWIPVSALFATLGLVARFALGPESAPVRYTVIAVGATAGGLVAALTWRLRRRRESIDIPPASRALVAATPLGRIADR